MKSNLTKMVVGVLILCFTTILWAKDPVFSTRRGAIKGYDTVAYFTIGKPTKGKKEFSHKWNGATWLFANQAHLELFKRDPEKYAPQYGGYCAYGMLDGKKISTKPGSWQIHNDKLYMNYNRSIQVNWIQDKDNYIVIADEQYKKLEEAGK